MRCVSMEGNAKTVDGATPMRKRLLVVLGSVLATACLCFGQEPGWTGPMASDVMVSPTETGPSPAGEFTFLRGDGNTQAKAWVNAEYLLWWVSNAPLPVPIATTVSGQAAVPASPPNAGALGVNGTQVLSPHSLDAGAFSGVRLTAGLWLDCANCMGAEVSGFLLPTQVANFRAVSTVNNGPALLVPFFNPADSPPGENALPIGGRSQASGQISASNSTELWGTSANGIFNLFRNDRYSVTLLGGARYLDLADDLRMDFSSTTSGPSTLVFNDRFSTRNQFWGGNLGARGEVDFGKIFTSVSAQVALGDMHESVNVNGATSFTSATDSFQNGGGLFAQPSNTGRQTSNVFAVVPEVGVQLGYNVCCHVQIFGGYDFLYVSDVGRPGDQVNGRINPSQGFGRPLVGPAAPQPLFNHSDLTAQGVNFGLAFRY
jgi:hypothetical protein